MGAQSRLFASLASGSGKATAVVVCAVMLLAGCGGSGWSASDASTPVIRGDVAEAGVSGTTVIAPGVPAAPTGAAGDSKVTVTVAQGSSGGTPATYTVTAVGTSKTCTVTGATGSCDVTGLTNGTPYTFTATATNEGGASGMSTPSNSVTPVAAVTTATVRTVTFDSGYAGLSTIYTQTGSSPAALLPNTFRWGSMSFLGWNTDRYGHLNNTGEWFAAGAEYSFASDIVLYAQWGERGQPYNIRAQVQGPGKVGVTFSAARNPDGTFYTDFTVYELQVYKDGTYVSSKNVNAEGTYTFDNLSGGNYFIYVIYRGRYVGTRPAKLDVPAAATSNVTVPGTPPAPTVVAGTAKITATVAAGTSGGAPTSYTVKAYTVNGTEAGTSCTVTGASGSCEVTALTAGSTYTVKASAKNTGGTSGESVASSPVTVATVPGAPALTSIARKSGTEVWVRFTAPSSDGGVPITGYTVTVKGPNGGSLTQSFPAQAGRVSVGPLNNKGFYTFTVRAVNSVGTSKPSNKTRILYLG